MQNIIRVATKCKPPLKDKLNDKIWLKLPTYPCIRHLVRNKYAD